MQIFQRVRCVFFNQTAAKQSNFHIKELSSHLVVNVNVPNSPKAPPEQPLLCVVHFSTPKQKKPGRRDKQKDGYLQTASPGKAQLLLKQTETKDSSGKMSFV